MRIDLIYSVLFLIFISSLEKSIGVRGNSRTLAAIFFIPLIRCLTVSFPCCPSFLFIILASFRGPESFVKQHLFIQTDRD